MKALILTSILMAVGPAYSQDTAGYAMRYTIGSHSLIANCELLGLSDLQASIGNYVEARCNNDEYYRELIDFKLKYLEQELAGGCVGGVIQKVYDDIDLAINAAATRNSNKCLIALAQTSIDITPAQNAIQALRDATAPVATSKKQSIAK